MDSETISDVPQEKKKRAKKGPSDFEIVRTLFTRLHERKLAFIFKNLGEENNIYFFCSQKEDNLLYGSSAIAIGLLEITHPDLLIKVESILAKLYGFDAQDKSQRIIHVRDQFSELAKTKGETIDGVVKQNDAGAVWLAKKNKLDKDQPLEFVSPIDSLFHFYQISDWSKRYYPLLTTNLNSVVYVPYRYLNKETSSLVTIEEDYLKDSPLKSLYPKGFRNIMTKGLDVLITKNLEEFPYPIQSEEFIIFAYEGGAVQLAHRVIGDGWRMLVTRPNAVFFPENTLSLPLQGPHVL